MSILNNNLEYGLLSKLFHWLTAAGLIIQIPLGFYLVDLDFDQFRIDIENYHILFGLLIFYMTYLPFQQIAVRQTHFKSWRFVAVLLDWATPHVSRD